MCASTARTCRKCATGYGPTALAAGHPPRPGTEHWQPATLIFTGEIGEHSSEIRRLVCERLRWLGVALDPSANGGGNKRISAENSTVEVLVIPTDEEMTIARQCAAVLSVNH